MGHRPTCLIPCVHDDLQDTVGQQRTNTRTLPIRTQDVVAFDRAIVFTGECASPWCTYSREATWNWSGQSPRWRPTTDGVPFFPSVLASVRPRRTYPSKGGP